MTTETENKVKKIPAYQIYSQMEDGKLHRIGTAFKHGKGDGCNILIGEKRFVAFPPKPKTFEQP